MNVFLAFALLASQTAKPAATPLGIQSGKTFIPAATIFEELFKTKPPKGTSIVRFEHDGPGMDPSFAFEFAPADPKFLTAVIKNSKLKRSKTPVESNSRWSSKWPRKKIDILPEAYIKEFQDGGLYHLWVDRAGKRIYAEFLGT